MKTSLFDLDTNSQNYRRSDYAKLMASKARKSRAGARSDSSPMDDAALEATGRVLRYSTDERHLVSLIRIVKQVIPTERQLDGGVEMPTAYCRKHAETLVIDLFESFDLVPDRVAGSVEGGILFVYKRGDGLRLQIEVDNDGDIVGVISTSEKVVRSEIIDLPAKLSQLVRDFKLSRLSSV